jgi:hypothetical protein
LVYRRYSYNKANGKTSFITAIYDECAHIPAKMKRTPVDEQLILRPLTWIERYLLSAIDELYHGNIDEE